MVGLNHLLIHRTKKGWFEDIDVKGSCHRTLRVGNSAVLFGIALEE